MDASDVIAGTNLTVSCTVLNMSTTGTSYLTKVWSRTTRWFPPSLLTVCLYALVVAPVIKALEIRLIKDVDAYLVRAKAVLPAQLIAGKSLAKEMAGGKHASAAAVPASNPVDTVVKSAPADAAPAASDKGAGEPVGSGGVGGGGSGDQDEAVKEILLSRRSRPFHLRVPRKQLLASGMDEVEAKASAPAIVAVDTDGDGDGDEDEDEDEVALSPSARAGWAHVTVPVPPEAPPTWSSVHGRVGYTLEVRLVTAVGTPNPVLTFPITVHRCGTVTDPALDPALDPDAAAEAYYAYYGYAPEGGDGAYGTSGGEYHTYPVNEAVVVAGSGDGEGTAERGAAPPDVAVSPSPVV